MHQVGDGFGQQPTLAQGERTYYVRRIELAPQHNRIANSRAAKDDRGGPGRIASGTDAYAAAW